MSNSRDHNVSAASRPPAPAGGRYQRYQTVDAPQAYQGIGWALCRAYPTAGQSLPSDMLSLLEILDKKDSGSGRG